MPTRPTAQDNSDWTWHDDNGLTRVINVNGTMTSLGASRAHPDVARATAEAMGHFLRIHEMQAKASATIAALTGAEAGCLTASASAGITLAVAGCITGLDPARAEALPRNPGARCEVAVQAGHLCAYGAPVSTAVELAGGTVRGVGQSTLAMDHQLRAALGPQTAAGLYVVSHHVVHYGQVPFGRFTEICHAAAFRSSSTRRRNTTCGASSPPAPTLPSIPRTSSWAAPPPGSSRGGGTSCARPTCRTSASGAA
jgi:D-glucosaminate-6-phosphate ammonia-lyase